MINQNIFLLLGSNMGDRARNLTRCSELIEIGAGRLVRRSSMYETTPWGKTDQANFLNQALQVESASQPHELLAICLAIEKKIGRVRVEPWAARTIDIDIIYFDTEIIDLDDLKIPHPRATERRFVLTPIAEIAPDFVHPVLMKTSAQLLRVCTDPLEVRVFSGNVR